jgi:2-(1,2-epoxy-1,2-dihydrophenyl)acetyl-CoA isomerase
MPDDVLFEKRPDGLALITLNRPDSLNAMGGQLMPLLATYLEQCAHDSAVRCVVLTGAGRAFCAGGDVKGMAQRPDAGLAQSSGGDPSTSSGQAPSASSGQAPKGMAQRPEPRDGSGGERARSIIGMLDEGLTVLREIQFRTSYVLHTMPKPTIAMVNGYAVGAGFSLALACDIRIASDQAKFGTAFRNVGLSGDFGGSFFLQRLVGSGKARELYFTAEILDAQEAHRLGIANRVVAHDQLADETLALGTKLASGPTAAYARMKENHNLATHVDLKTLLDHEALNMRLAGMSNDSREAVRAFVEKREPKFAGS